MSIAQNEQLEYIKRSYSVAPNNFGSYSVATVPEEKQGMQP